MSDGAFLGVVGVGELHVKIPEGSPPPLEVVVERAADGGRFSYRAVDVGSLLALAREMGELTWYESERDHRLAEGFARRVREACGEADAAADREGRGVTIPPVRTFPRVDTGKAQALKPLEEAAEIYAAWQAWQECGGRVLEDYARSRLVDECCDTIMAACNLLSALGVTDLTGAMAACVRRNERRGRYDG